MPFRMVKIASDKRHGMLTLDIDAVCWQLRKGCDPSLCPWRHLIGSNGRGYRTQDWRARAFGEYAIAIPKGGYTFVLLYKFSNLGMEEVKKCAPDKVLELNPFQLNFLPHLEQEHFSGR